MSEPLVSVIVPTADRPIQLQRCREALERLDYPRDRLEVIVVDDAGKRRGPGAARNLGAARAQGDLLAFTDDDCLPDPGWVRGLVQAHVACPEAAIGGRTVNALTNNGYAEASQHIHDLVYAHYNREPHAARLFASNNVAFPRAGYVAIGGFDESFRFASEDRDLCDRWRASGRPLHFAADALVRHAHDLDLTGFLAQHLAYGRGAARFHRLRARRGTGRLRDEAGFHLDPSLYLRTLRLRPGRRAARTVALLSLWQAANAAGYALERRHVP